MMRLGKVVLATAGMAVGGVGVLLVVPVVLGTVGFTSGLTAVSYAAVAMVNGGGVAGVVALLKIAGLAILSAVAAAVVASVRRSVRAGVGWVMSKVHRIKEDKNEEKAEEDEKYK